MRTKCGLFGGSFNPIHNGHTQLGRFLCEKGLVNELWFMVSPLNPLKQSVSDTLLNDEERLHLAELAVEGDEHLKVSDFEMHLPRPSYMANTLKALRKAYPQHDFVLVIGADNWAVFPQWYHPEEILSNHEIIIYPRPGYPIDASTLPFGVTLTDTPLLDISSTNIRARITEGNYHGEGLDKRVWKEIKEKGLYR